MVNITLRMNLFDFLNESYEEEVIQKLEDVHNDSIKYYLSLWYEDGSIVPEDLKKFLLEEAMRWDDERFERRAQRIVDESKGDLESPILSSLQTSEIICISSCNIHVTSLFLRLLLAQLSCPRREV